MYVLYTHICICYIHTEIKDLALRARNPKFASMAKGKTNKDKDLAEFLFVEAGMSQRDISAQLGYSENAISTWAKDGNWKDLKNALVMSPSRLRANLLKQASTILENADDEKRPVNSKEMDTIAKITAALDRLDKKSTASVAMAVLTEFSEFAKTVDLLLIQKTIPLQREFIKQKLQGDGKEV